MNKKLPSIYKSGDYMHVNNNKSIFRSDTKVNTIKKNFDFNYPLNTPVIIETFDNRVIKSKITAKLKDHVLTSNNEIIKLENIKLIKTS